MVISIGVTPLASASPAASALTGTRASHASPRREAWQTLQRMWIGGGLVTRQRRTRALLRNFRGRWRPARSTWDPKKGVQKRLKSGRGLNDSRSGSEAATAGNDGLRPASLG